MRKIIGTAGVLLIVLWSTHLFSQTFTVGNFDTLNAATSYPSAYGDAREGYRAQFIYTKQDLLGAGVLADNIIKLGFTVNALNNTGVHEQYRIKLSLRPDTIITGNNWLPQAADDVFGPVDYTPMLGLNLHELNSPFYWDGNQSLVVEICHAFPDPTGPGNNTFSSNPSVEMDIASQNINRSRALNDRINYCGTSQMGQDGGQNLRPKLQLILCVKPDSIFLNDISSISAQIGWDHPGGIPSDQYEFVYGPSGFLPDGSNALGSGITTDTFTNIVDLNGAETYGFYVRSLCGPTGFSRWAGPFQFTTDPSCGDVYNFLVNPPLTYDTSEYFVTTLCPDEPDVALGINVFTTFIGPGDELRIYNGNSLLSPPMDTLTGVGLIGKYQSTTASGCLTLEFDSDTIASLLDLGWLFEVTCATLGNDSCYKVLQLDSLDVIDYTKSTFQWADMFGSPNYNFQLLELPQPAGPIQSGTVADTFVTFSDLAPGTRYRLLVQSVCTNGINSFWDIIEFVTPLDCGSIEVSCDQIGKTYSRSGTGLWYTPEKDCNPNNPTPTPGKEQLFTFIAPNTKAYTLDMYQTTNSGVYVTYYYKEKSMGCDSLDWICIDDFGPLGSAPMGSALNPLIAGKTYLILADAQSTTSVQQRFRITDCGPPTNDLPENAVLIELNSPCEANIFANDGATYSLGEPDPDAEISLLDSVAGRWLESADKTVWFKFVAPYSETVTIYTNQKQLNPNEDTQVALYEVEDSSNYSIFKLLESDEDNGNNNDNLLGFNSVFSYTGLVPLQTYYIQVDGWGAKGEGTFCIRVADAAERAFVGDCLDRYAVAVDSGSVDWYNLYATPDNLDIGLLVAAINPNGNKLDSVFYQIGVAPTGDSTIYDGIPHMRTYINIQTKNTPLASTPISIRLFYSDAELAELKAISTAPNADYLDLVVSHHHGPIEDCEYINNGGPFGTLIDYFNQRYQLNGSFYLEFSTQTLGEFVARLSDIALPLELLTFHGETLDGSNRLYWTTATEQNVEWHRVERSLNGVTWSEIGKIPAQNQLGATMSYDFDDTKPPHSAYYRLRSTDFDGLASVSPAIQMVRAVDQLAVTAMYPSPTPDRLLVQFFVPREDNVELRLTDLNGRVVVQQSFEVNDGANQQELSLAHLPAGLYMITIHDSFTGTEPVRVVKQ